ncbi:MAG: hypothetical protein NVSMB21_25890 [Vulcanimicrobiaceae bacterium]
MQRSLDRLLRTSLREYAPYKPGTSVDEVKRRYGIEHPVKLSQNENPLGTSPKALAAMRQIAGLSDYDEDDHRALRERLAAPYALDVANVILGHGSNELVMLVFNAFVDLRDEVVIAKPTFSLFRKDALAVGARTIEVPLRDGGLAAVRFGYGYASPDLVTGLTRVRLPFNVARPAAVAVRAALDDDAFINESIANNVRGLRQLTDAFAVLGVHAYPSAANFVAVEVPVAAEDAYVAFLKRGVIVRSGDGLGMPGRVRVTVGTADENAAFLEAFEALLALWRARPLEAIS